jgi:hypothetical protein
MWCVEAMMGAKNARPDVQLGQRFAVEWFYARSNSRIHRALLVVDVQQAALDLKIRQGDRTGRPQARSMHRSIPSRFFYQRRLGGECQADSEGLR